MEMKTDFFELAPPELRIPLKANYAGRTYSLTHRLRPPAAGDWCAYEAALRLAVEELPPHADGEHGSSEPRYRFHARSSDAAAALWDRLVLGIEGYAFPSSSNEVGGAPPRAGQADIFTPPPAGPVREPEAGLGGADTCPERSRRVPVRGSSRSTFRSGEDARSDSSPEVPVGRGFNPANNPAALAATLEGVRGKPSSPAAGRPGSPEAGWQSLIPLAHKEAAIRSLTLVAPAELEDAQDGGLLPLAAERIPVVLEAARAGEAYPRLLHWFRPPALDDERRYRRLMAETLMVGGSRGSRALIPPRLPVLCRLYDSLILTVERYALNHSAEISAELLARHMDAWHKRAAVQVLFGDADGAEPTGDPLGGANDEGVA